VVLYVVAEMFAPVEAMRPGVDEEAR